MPILDLLQKDIVAAMKAREEARLSTLRMMKAALHKAHVDANKPMDDAADMQILKSMMKQRTDSADMFRKGGREEQALKEESERALIETYLPAGATEAEIDAAIAEAVTENNATAKQMGIVIKAVQAKLAGKTVDGRALSEKIKAKLA